MFTITQNLIGLLQRGVSMAF